LAEAKLANAEAQVEDLKQRLDDALGAEDMLEQLTERNLHMSEVSWKIPRDRCDAQSAHTLAHRRDASDD
jgi:hypothetical protein